MIDLTMVASAGLELLAWWGNGSVLREELAMQNIVVQHPINGDSTPSAFSDGVGGRNPTREDLFVTCNGRKESLANGGVEFPDGSKWAMYHPTCHPDHFIIEYANGTFERWDVGSDEGHCQPFQVRVEDNQVVYADTGLPVPPGDRSNRGSCNAPLVLVGSSSPEQIPKKNPTTTEMTTKMIPNKSPKKNPMAEILIPVPAAEAILVWRWAVWRLLGLRCIFCRAGRRRMFRLRPITDCTIPKTAGRNIFTARNGNMKKPIGVPIGRRCVRANPKVGVTLPALNGRRAYGVRHSAAKIAATKPRWICRLPPKDGRAAGC